MNESKESIIKASLSLFMNNSYAGVSMRDILSKAGLSRGAFYHYFESKEACFEECVRYYLTQVTHPEPADYTGVGLKAFLEENLTRISGMSGTASMAQKILFFNDAIKIIPNFVVYMERRNTEELAVWAKVIENAIKAGEIKGNIPAGEIAALFITQCDGILVTRGMTTDYKAGYAEVKKQWSNLYSLIKK